MRKSKYATSKHCKVSVEQSWYADVFSPRHASPLGDGLAHMGIARDALQGILQLESCVQLCDT